ncbi:Rieske 2Fe-2S domain-containing protein, partial [Hymenobacter terrestris]
MPSEINLAPADALQDGEMRAYPATPDTEVLLVRREGQYRALAARCPHYGAPLEKGRIINDQIVCPWHHACFRVDDG